MAQLRKPRGQPTRIAYWYAAAVIGILLVFFLGTTLVEHSLR